MLRTLQLGISILGFQLPKIISVNCTFVHIGKHPLKNRGVHYDLPWLKRLSE